LGLKDREQQEAVAGVWLFEISDLAGLRKAEIEHVKAFASRNCRSRQACLWPVPGGSAAADHLHRHHQPRRLSAVRPGNRRFWPVATSHIDVEALARDRDQLWAEAVFEEFQGVSIGLPERLWALAGEQQKERLEGDEWFELIARYVATSTMSAFRALCDNNSSSANRTISAGRCDAAGAILKDCTLSATTSGSATALPGAIGFRTKTCYSSTSRTLRCRNGAGAGGNGFSVRR